MDQQMITSSADTTLEAHVAFRRHELNIGDLGHVLVCPRCVSDYHVARRNECGCRAANAAAGMQHDFEFRVGERASRSAFSSNTDSKE